MKFDRNTLCPCGSGKKFKKCHLGREDEILFNEPEEISEEVSRLITSLPAVEYGRSGEMLAGLDLKALTGSSRGIKFIDLNKYSSISFFGRSLADSGKPVGGSVFVNIYKTGKTDPDNIYIAISPDVGDSVLAHQVAHALDYLSGSGLMPGMGRPLGMELEVPIEHLEHPAEYGRWLEHVSEKFNVRLDADDMIILYLHRQGKLLSGKDISGQDGARLKAASKEMLAFLSSNGAEITGLIRERAGYIGPQLQKD